MTNSGYVHFATMSATPDAVNHAGAIGLPATLPTALALLCTCFVLSGIAALVYQTAWTRQFAHRLRHLRARRGHRARGVHGRSRARRVARRAIPAARHAAGAHLRAARARHRRERRASLVPLLLWLANARAAGHVRRPALAARQRSAGTTLFYLAERVRRAGRADHADGRDAADARALRGRRGSADRPAHRHAVRDEHRRRGRRRAGHGVLAAAGARPHAHHLGRRRAQRSRVPARRGARARARRLRRRARDMRSMRRAAVPRRRVARFTPCHRFRGQPGCCR